MKENMTGGQAMARALVKMGADRLYGIIGTSNVAFVDALYEARESIRYISCRHEQVAASMADTEGRLTGRPGAVLVHSGPGALNAMISAGNAYKDSSPFIIIAGAVKRRLTESNGMLEVDHRRLFAPLCKGTYRVEATAELPDVFAWAYRVCMSGARGPVLIEVPEDVWLEPDAVDIDGMSLETDPPPPVQEKEVEAALEALRGAQRPLLLSGGGVAYSRSSEQLTRFAEMMNVPVVTTGNGRGTIPESHPLSLGRVGFGGGNAVADKALERCDALLCLGAGISDMTTYEFTLPVRADHILVVGISPGLVAPQSPPAKLVLCDVVDFLSLAVERLAKGPVHALPWVDEELAETRAMWEMMMQAALNREGERPAAARVVSEIARRVPDDTIVSVGAGMHLLYPMTFMPCNRPLTFMSTVNFGSMGFGMAASMAAKLIYPDRYAVAFLGDGDFMMTMQDLETAVREEIGMKVFILNDSQYRVLNFRQKLQFGGRVYGTEHGNPDFRAMAESFGAAGYRLDSPADIEQTVEAALAEKGPVVVDVVIDPEDMPPMNVEANLRMSAG